MARERQGRRRPTAPRRRRARCPRAPSPRPTRNSRPRWGTPTPPRRRRARCPGPPSPRPTRTSRRGWVRSGWPSRWSAAACSASRTPPTPRVTACSGCPAARGWASPRPYASYLDEVADALGSALEAAGVGFSDAIERVVADRGELTLYVRRERLPEVAPKFCDDPVLRFEPCG